MLMEHTTIKEVAARAKVSAATVSRILSGKYPHKPKTVEHVQRVIEELRLARRNRPPNSIRVPECVGIVMFAYRDFLNHSYNATLVSSVMEAIVAENLTGMMIALSTQSLHIDSIKELIKAHHLRGLLIPEFDMLYTLSSQLEKLPIPVIGIGDVRAGFRRNVCSNSYQAGCDAANYLWSSGHRSFGILSMAKTDLCQQQRISGFQNTVAELGGDPGEIWSREYRSLADSVSGAVSELVNRPAPPTALFSTNSIITRKLYAGLFQAGVRIPDDISLLSFEEDGELEHLPVPISVLRQPTREMGAVAVAMLSKCIRGIGMIEREVLNCSLMIRKSVKRIPTE